MNGMGHNSVFSTWRTLEIFAVAKADIMRNIASSSERMDISSILRSRRLWKGKLYYLNPTLVTFAHKTRILNGFGAETSVFFSKLYRFFHLYRNKSLPSIDDFWSILQIIHWAFVFSWVCGGSRCRTEVIWHFMQALEKKTHPPQNIQQWVPNKINKIKQEKG